MQAARKEDIGDMMWHPDAPDEYIIRDLRKAVWLWLQQTIVHGGQELRSTGASVQSKTFAFAHHGFLQVRHLPSS